MTSVLPAVAVDNVSSVYSDVYEDIPNESSKVNQKKVDAASSDEEGEDGEMYENVPLEHPTPVDAASSDEEGEDGEVRNFPWGSKDSVDAASSDDEGEDGETYDDVTLERPTPAPHSSDVTSSTGPPPLPNNPPKLPNNPPPLPNNPPPVDRLNRRKAGPNDETCGLNFEAEMTAKFSEDHSQSCVRGRRAAVSESQEFSRLCHRAVTIVF
ncbi:hypothetical protein NP493_417g00009 [Ridgeia piscesae]|uniref:Uncharacterized protein n=1 Tax=Ridgeia piscesae TaxID=27915 RepID=A0AAD9L227_RIDPI|nr:hypothetical protein NP493_417g00009 [Ridgeia piscesae]